MEATENGQVEEMRRVKVFLNEHLKPGDTLGVINRWSSRNGDKHFISVIATVNGEPMEIDYWIKTLLGEKISRKHGGVSQGGGGMDMGFNLVYQIGAKLWPGGFQCAGEKCQSNDHSGYDKPGRDGEAAHSDSGYALRRQWL